MSIIRVAISVPLQQYFDYLLPDGLANKVQAGMRVKVPFGYRSVIGVVVELVESSDYPLDKLKSIIQLLDQRSIFPADLWKLLFWAADYYHYPIGEVLFNALPILLREGKPAVYVGKALWQLTPLGQSQPLTTFQRQPKQRQLIVSLQQRAMDLAGITELDISANIVNTLRKKGYIEKIQQEKVIDPWLPSLSIMPSPFTLNDQQSQAINRILADQHFQVWLVEGVTGSGKTEVYLSVLDDVLRRGQQALILVPEISLTPQTIARFKARYTAPIDVLHSGLNESERLQVWLNSRDGHNAIVIGTRSALFTPFHDLGVIIIDEEHDSSYKQQDGFRYHARDLAILRSKTLDIPIILGSATPSLESAYNAKLGKYQLINLTERAGNATLAQQHLIDLKGAQLQLGLSPVVIQRMRHHLQKNNQVMVFINRRGYSPALLCHDCGWIAECPRCEHYYTVHLQRGVIRCHHCDNQRPMPNQCPQCGSTHLISVGIGTEQLEIELPHLFPDIPITRVDRDTTVKKGALEQHLNEISLGGARILIGTQILAKGHHFPHVTLVALVDVDGALFSADFRATERFAQLYIQVSGRAGREEKQGEVLLQTHHTEHPLLQTLLKRGYHYFSQQSLIERQAACLPPVAFQAMFRSQAHQSHDAMAFLQVLQQRFYQRAENDDQLWIMGPIPALHAKRAGRYRFQLLIQHVSRAKLHDYIRGIMLMIPQLPEAKKVRWSIDVDPIEG